jgi:hypothetical protein
MFKKRNKKEQGVLLLDGLGDQPAENEELG